MTNKQSIEADISHYSYYAKLPAWTKEEAVTLAVGLNPRNYDETIWAIRDHEELIPRSYHFSPFKQSLNRAVDCDKISSVEKNGVIYLKPVEFIVWWKAIHDNERPFPQQLEELVKQYHKITNNIIDWENKYNELQEENDRLKIKVATLENKPNTKSFNYYRKLAMGALVLKYGNEQAEIWRKWAVNNTSPEKAKGDLKFTNIEKDLEALNIEGVKIKYETISAKIKESADFLKP